MDVRVALLVLLSACRTSSWTTDAVCEELSVRICEGLEECDCRFDVRPYDANTCVDERTDACATSFDAAVGDALDERLLRFDDEAVEACLADVSAAATACDLDDDATPLPPSCDGMLVSPARLGDDCDIAVIAPCAGGDGLCQPDGSGLVCEAFTPEDPDETAPADVSEPCAETSECAEGLVCTDLACAPGTPLGDPCDGADPCGADRSCGRAPEQRVCVARDGVGASCEEGTCADGLACGYESHVCETLPGESQPCLDGAGCGAGLTCAFDTTTCVTLPGEGAACLSAAEHRCAEGLGCRDADQTCQAPSAAGEGAACLQNGPITLCADGLGCDFGAGGSTCVPVGGAGDPCTNDTVCGAGTYCEFSTLLCAQDFADGTPCEDGNECADTSECRLGPEGWRCAPIPGAAEPCQDACQDDLACKGPGGECVREWCVIP